MASQLRQAESDAATAVQRASGSVDDLDLAWAGAEPDAAEGRCRGVLAELATWPNTLGAAATTVERWAGVADEVATDARRAQWRLTDAHRITDPADRDVAIRSARSRISEADTSWRVHCARFGAELDSASNALAALGDRTWSEITPLARAVGLAVGADALGMNLDAADPSGELRASVIRVIGSVAASPHGALVFAVLETARDRDLFTADGELSRHDLAAVDETWAAEAVSVWQQATGETLDDETAAALVDMIPTVAALMRADGVSGWADADDSGFAPEPHLTAVLTDAAAAAFTKGPRFVSDRPVGTTPAEAIDVFTGIGVGDIDHLPAHPTASELGYHYHGPPSIPEGFDTLSVFRTLVFDWEQVWGENATWLGGGFEVAMAAPFFKPMRGGRWLTAAGRVDEAVNVLKSLNRADIAADASTLMRYIDDATTAHVDDLFDITAPRSRVLQGGLAFHEGPKRGHTIKKHTGRTREQLANRADPDKMPVVSTFDDLATAELAIEQALRQNASEIRAFVSSGKEQIRFSGTADRTVGTTYDARTGQFIGSSSVAVEIRADSSMPMGFRVHAAFLK